MTATGEVTGIDATKASSRNILAKSQVIGLTHWRLPFDEYLFPGRIMPAGKEKW